MFDETWRRFVVKMATGTGKTKVLSLVLAWSFYHKLYEPESGLARNFLVIAPNIIVLDRIYKDFQGLRNLSELAATKTLIETFKKAINALTVQDKGDAEIRDTTKLRQMRPFVAKDQGYLIPKKSVFNRIIGDSHFELLFARFLEDCDDVVSYAKNCLIDELTITNSRCHEKIVSL